VILELLAGWVLLNLLLLAGWVAMTRRRP